LRGFTLTADQRADLIAGVESLTDRALLADEPFTNPWPWPNSSRPRGRNCCRFQIQVRVLIFGRILDDRRRRPTTSRSSSGLFHQASRFSTEQGEDSCKHDHLSIRIDCDWLSSSDRR
jgi:hypothetical protein